MIRSGPQAGRRRDPQKKVDAGDAGGLFILAY